jgi:hypothetical protein
MKVIIYRAVRRFIICCVGGRVNLVLRVKEEEAIRPVDLRESVY